MMDRKTQSKTTLLLAVAGFLFAAYNLYASAWPYDFRYNWDLLAYVAVALLADGQPASDISALTYAAVRDHMPAGAFAELIGTTTNSFHRMAIYQTPEYFRQQLPYFAVKPLYPMALLGLHKVGMNFVDAATLVSLIGYGGICIILLLWFRSFLPSVAALSLALVVATNPTFLPISVFPSPDSWSVFLVVLVFYLAFKNQIRSALLIAIIGILVRPDNALLVGLISLYAVWRNAWLTGISSILCGAMVFLATKFLAASYPWSTFFYHSVVERVLAPADFTSPLTISGYIDAYWGKAKMNAIHNPFLMFFLSFGILGAIARFQRAGAGDVYFAFMTISLTYIVAHWFIIPNALPRYLAGYYIVIFIVLIKNLVDAYLEKAPGGIARPEMS